MSTNNKSPLHSVVVGCLVRNDDNKLLLIRHRKRGWEIPQGRVEEGENLLEALRREVLEESGVVIKVGPLAAVWSMVSLPPAVIFTFFGRYVSGELCGSDDSTEAGWFTEADAMEHVTGSVMRDRLKVLIEHRGLTEYRSYSTKPYQIKLEALLDVQP